MSALRPPELGPIVGHTGHDCCRIWVRGYTPSDEGARLADSLRTTGVLGVVDDRGRLQRHEDGRPVAYYFRLQREFDRTGTFLLGRDVALGGHTTDGVPKSRQERPYRLTPDTDYRVRVATLALDDPMPDAETLDDRALAERLPPIENMATLLEGLRAEECEARFRTFPAPDAPTDALAFLLGGCRYPGLLWKIKEADRIFGPMMEHVRPRGGRAPARFTVMTGDQIYADTFNRHIPLGRADTFEEFQERYHEAFGAPNMRRLLRHSPVYMILDDHEIEDNWSQDRLRDNHVVFNLALGAYMSYQWSHGPRTYGRQLFYRFECGGYPFFALDTRTQRFRDDAVGLHDNHLLGRPSIDPLHPGQLDIFLDWLEACQRERGNVPKFVVSASVFAPNPIDERLDPTLLEAGDSEYAETLLFEANRKRREGSDSWPAYPTTRRTILERIVAKGIQNVVFLTGDVHCANVAQLRFEGEQGDLGLMAYDITSSAFYWPFPFANGNPNDFVHDSTAAGQYDGFPLPACNATVHYRAWGFSQEDNFCRVEVDKARHVLRVRVFDRDGKPVSVGDERARRTEVNVLALAPWD